MTEHQRSAGPVANDHQVVELSSSLGTVGCNVCDAALGLPDQSAGTLDAMTAFITKHNACRPIIARGEES